MDAERIDHVNLRIPADSVEDAVHFYRDVLGFEPEKLDLYRDGERTSFAFRIADTAMLHVRPVDDFREPGAENYDHLCIVVDTPLDELKQLLEEHGVDIDREGTPWGSTGRAPAVYVTDPFGYTIELKTTD
ncbi:MAG: VOC family protein [Candidatus Nanohaloarchaea archaeon]|nr:VOC family protein [Candidatus Nanohaloarchaea archaeon]